MNSIMPILRTLLHFCLSLYILFLGDGRLNTRAIPHRPLSYHEVFQYIWKMKNIDKQQFMILDFGKLFNVKHNRHK